ncbi:hypothetical protein [Nocardioides sp.]|uniref:hypothetical protein n=1 Tax=Nocardioides sp. TaxID=35761 RepID=UPI002733FB12|nr:hypothetical protein [Nocardioides sp.]MDP3890185.1 hypothetical protein [Nocardioides sp.]
MTWKSFHNRGEVLRTVTAVADARQDGILPTDVDGVAETFGDDLTLLGALQLRWHTRLSGRIERELLPQPMDLEAAVVAAWQATVDEMPGTRAIIDHYRAEPTSPQMAEALLRAAAKEHMMLALMAGRSSAGDEVAAKVGAQIESRARATLRERPAVAAADEPGSLLDRLKAVLAAA